MDEISVNSFVKVRVSIVIEKWKIWFERYLIIVLFMVWIDM